MKNNLIESKNINIMVPPNLSKEEVDDWAVKNIEELTGRSASDYKIKKDASNYDRISEDDFYSIYLPLEKALKRSGYGREEVLSLGNKKYTSTNVYYAYSMNDIIDKLTPFAKEVAGSKKRKNKINIPRNKLPEYKDVDPDFDDEDQSLKADIMGYLQNNYGLANDFTYDITPKYFVVSDIDWYEDDYDESLNEAEEDDNSVLFNDFEDEEYFECPDCGDALTPLGAFGNYFEYKCPICNKYFYSKNGELITSDELDDRYYENPEDSPYVDFSESCLENMELIEASTSAQSRKYVEDNIINGFVSISRKPGYSRYLVDPRELDYAGEKEKYKISNISKVGDKLILSLFNNRKNKNIDLTDIRQFNPDANWKVYSKANSYTGTSSTTKLNKTLLNFIKEYQNNFNSYAPSGAADMMVRDTYDIEPVRTSKEGEIDPTTEYRDVTYERWVDLARVATLDREKYGSRAVLVDGVACVNAAAACDYIFYQISSDEDFRDVVKRRNFNKKVSQLYKAASQPKGSRFLGFDVRLMTEDECLDAAELFKNKNNRASKNESLSLKEASANSNGIYSLKNGWLKTPVKDDIPDSVDLEPELSEWRQRAAECGTIDEVDSFIDDIYKLRQESLLAGGEYDKGNLIFKEIRNDGTLQQLKDKKAELETKEMSLESLTESELNEAYTDEEKKFIKKAYSVADAYPETIERFLDKVNAAGLSKKARWRINEILGFEDEYPHHYDPITGRRVLDGAKPWEDLPESLGESALNEASADKQKFIDKFGQEAFDTFWNNKQRLKQKGISVDILYHVKNTSPEQMQAIIDELNNTLSKNQQDKKIKREGVDVLFEDNNWLVMRVKTYDAAKRYCSGTVWCIAGNYGGAESQGQFYFNHYLGSYYKEYILYIDKKNNRKYMACTFKDDPSNADVWYEDDSKPLPNPMHITKKIPGSPPEIPGVPDVSGMITNSNDLGDQIIADLKDMTVIPSRYFSEVHWEENFELTIPDNITEIQRRAFLLCTRLTKCYVPNSVVKIGDDAFMGCNRLTEIWLPEQFTSQEEVERLGINVTNVKTLVHITDYV